MVEVDYHITSSGRGLEGGGGGGILQRTHNDIWRLYCQTLQKHGKGKKEIIQTE